MRRAERGLFKGNNEANQPLMCPDDNLEHKMQHADAAGVEAEMLLHVGDSQLEYSHLPPSTETPLGRADITKVSFSYVALV